MSLGSAQDLSRPPHPMTSVSLPTFAPHPTLVRDEVAPSKLPATADVPGLYVHVPFCFHKCHYCDFYSITRQTPDRMSRFVDLVLAEADQWASSPVSVR